MEFLFFLFIAILLVWGWRRDPGPRISDSVSLKTILLSAFFEDGPVRYDPEDPPADKHESEDPNSNPHYIWDEQGRDQKN